VWESTVRVEREQLVDADPEKVWDLVSSLAALSAMPARFAFEVPAAVAGTDRLCCMIVATRVAHCAVLDVREQVPGQMITWQTRNTRPAGKQVLTLAVLPRQRGCAIRTAVSDVVRWTARARYQQFWRQHVKRWAERLASIAEGRIPWPPAAIPEGILQVCSARMPLDEPTEVSAAVLINAPAAAVWEAVRAPESIRLIDPEHVVYAGHVPGSPEHEAGEMRVFVRRHREDRFSASIQVVQEVTSEHTTVTQDLAPPYAELVHTLTPAEDGTRLELTCRWPARAYQSGAKTGAGMAEHMRAMADGYQAMIETPGSI
jgi:uncharacterized protein YndB with AHSA1/START domain